MFVYVNKKDNRLFLKYNVKKPIRDMKIGDTIILRILDVEVYTFGDKIIYSSPIELTNIWLDTKIDTTKDLSHRIESKDFSILDKTFLSNDKFLIDLEIERIEGRRCLTFKLTRDIIENLRNSYADDTIEFRYNVVEFTSNYSRILKSTGFISAEKMLQPECKNQLEKCKTIMEHLYVFSVKLKNDIANNNISKDIYPLYDFLKHNVIYDVEAEIYDYIKTFNELPINLLQEYCPNILDGANSLKNLRLIFS